MGVFGNISAVIESVSTHAAFLCVSGLCFLVFYFLRTYARLRHIPGPFLAAFTNIPRLRWVLTGKAHDIHTRLHRKYGKLVRFGPNMVSISDPKEIPNIYGFNGKYLKSDFYHVILPYVKGKVMPGLFATQDENLHRILKRPIASIYSMSNLVSFESYVDSTTQVFFERLDTLFVNTGNVCDFDVWLQLFAFDVIGEITFSKRLGFLERGEDVDNIMASIWGHFSRVAPVGQMPWVDSLWAKNPILSRLRATKTNPIVAFALARMAERQSASQNPSEKKQDANSRDFLSRFIEAKAKEPSSPPWALLAWTTSNVTAGSDTTAIVLRTIFYNLLKYPETLQRLLAELDDAAKKGRLSELVTWKESRELPYLDAVIKEAGRIHPPFGLPLERIVPEEGATICGEYFEGGTVVGISAWVVHRDKETFGEDCDSWRPERWIDCDETTRKNMEHGLLTFGAGHRSCIGKNISYLEIYKLVPTILQRYDIEFEDPEASTWNVENRWFVNQTGLRVRLRKKGKKEAVEIA